MCFNNHSSVKCIKNDFEKCEGFSFKEITSQDMCKVLQEIGTSKATGYDEVSAKLLKLGSESLCQPLTIPFNKCITECIFPTQLKLAIVYPICKKMAHL